MVACGRGCCICHKFCGIKVECHHIVQPEDGGPDTYENCIPLCFDCHADVGHYSDKHPKGTKYTPTELRLQRDRWYKMVEEGTHEREPHDQQRMAGAMPSNSPALQSLRDTLNAIDAIQARRH